MSDGALVQDILSPYGQCDKVEGGQDALDIFKQAHLNQQPYDLVFLDIVMPEMDGRQVLKQMRHLEQTWKISLKKATSIIMLSTIDTVESVIEAFYQGGCTAYLTKPVSKQKLLKKIETLKGACC